VYPEEFRSFSLSRIADAISSFFGILFSGTLSPDLAKTYGYTKAVEKKPEPKAAPVPVAKTSDGALQMLGILQREARLIDFLMEDISAYQDDQVGAAVRTLHEQAGKAISRYVTLAPVIDGVEGTYTESRAAGPLAKDNAALKFLGNVPAQGKPQGGTLRHKGWHAAKVDLPEVKPAMSVHILAPAEIEIE